MTFQMSNVQTGVIGSVTFDPATGEVIEDRPEWLGRRRKLEASAVSCRPFRWPTDRKQRYDLFDTWHDLAMFVLNASNPKGSYRLMAVARKVFRWDIAGIVDTDEQLAERAGRCSVKAIGRDIRRAKRLGLIANEMGWRRPNGGGFRKTRIIRLTVPIVLPDGYSLAADTFPHLDAHGPESRIDHSDAHGPNHSDAHGPNSIDQSKKGSADAA